MKIAIKQTCGWNTYRAAKLLLAGHTDGAIMLEADMDAKGLCVLRIKSESASVLVMRHAASFVLGCMAMDEFRS